MESGVPYVMITGTCCLPVWCVESWALVQPRRPCLEVGWDKVYWFYVFIFICSRKDLFFQPLLAAYSELVLLSIECSEERKILRIFKGFLNETNA